MLTVAEAILELQMILANVVYINSLLDQLAVSSPYTGFAGNIAIICFNELIEQRQINLLRFVEIKQMFPELSR